MTLQWLRQEVKKKPETVDWFQVQETANILYRKYNKSNLTLQLSKGFINIVRVNYSWSSSKFSDEIKQFHPNAKVITASTQAAANKYIKDKTITSETIKDELIVILTDKSTIDCLFNGERKMKLPMLKFKLTENTSYSKENKERKTIMTWKGEGMKPVKWEKGKGLAIKRDDILTAIFNN